MADIRDRFRVADLIAAPADWPELDSIPSRDLPPERRGGTVAAGLVIVVLLAGLLIPILALGHLGRGSSAAGPPPSRFISVRLAAIPRNGTPGFSGLVVSSSRDGAILRELLPKTRRGMTVTGASLDRAGDLWVTYSSGPACGLPGTIDCGPAKPHSCANEIDRLDLPTGRLTVVMRTGDDVRLSGATLSPDGSLLAYSERGCAPFFGNPHLRVIRLSGGRSWTIGGGLPNCDVMSAPSWSLDGRSLLVAYAASAGSEVIGVGDSCPATGRWELVAVDATTPQAGFEGRTANADPGCQIEAVTAAASDGAYAIEGCGPPDYLSGPARLLHFDAAFRQVGRVPLGRCTDGSDLASDRTGTEILVSAYLYCNPPGTPGPVTKVWTYDGRSLRPVLSVPGGEQSVDHVTW